MKEKQPWELHLERKHGVPIERVPGTVYVICYLEPAIVRSVSNDYPVRVQADGKAYETAVPIRHYVGWSYKRAEERIRAHAPEDDHGRWVSHTLRDRTQEDERALKLTGSCPHCREPLRDSLDPEYLAAVL